MRNESVHGTAAEQIGWVVRVLLESELSIKSEFDWDQSIASVVPDVDDFEILCEELETVFPHRAGGQKLVPKFSDRVQPARESCTFKDLALFISENYIAIGVKPTTVFGQTCETAGAFYALEEIVSQVDPLGVRISPSTRVLERLHGRQLSEFVSYLHLLTCGRGTLYRRIRCNDNLVSIMTLLAIPLVIAFQFLLGTLLLPRMIGHADPIFAVAITTFMVMFGTAFVCLGFQHALTRFIYQFSLLPKQSYTFRELSQDVVKTLAAN